MCMGRGITSVPEIGLDLDQSHHEPHARIKAMNEAASDQLASHDAAISGVEILAKWAAEVHRSSIRKALRECLRLGPG